MLFLCPVKAISDSIKLVAWIALKIVRRGSQPIPGRSLIGKSPVKKDLASTFSPYGRIRGLYSPGCGFAGGVRPRRLMRRSGGRAFPITKRRT